MPHQLLADMLWNTRFRAAFGGSLLALREWEVKKKHGTDRLTLIWDQHTQVGQTDTHLGQTDTHMGRTDRQTHMWDGQTDRHTCPMKNSFYARNFFVCGPIPDLGFFQTPPMHGVNMLNISQKLLFCIQNSSFGNLQDEYGVKSLEKHVSNLHNSF